MRNFISWDWVSGRPSETGNVRVIPTCACLTTATSVTVIILKSQLLLDLLCEQTVKLTFEKFCQMSFPPCTFRRASR